MLIGSTKKKHDFLRTSLDVDTWVSSYDKEGNIEDTFGGKTKMEEVKEILYLGVKISDDGRKKTRKNILHKQNRAIGIKKQIMSMVKDLGKYTMECGFIYLNSLLRRSILYATETMIDIKEEDFRSIEKIEEDQMRKLKKWRENIIKLDNTTSGTS